MNLNGWDTGYATTIAQVNKDLGDPKSVPSSFSTTVTKTKVEGRFGPWSIVAGGAGQLLHLKIMIAAGTISGGSDPSADLAGVGVLLEIDLQLLPSNLPSQQKLSFNFKIAGTKDTPSAPGVVKPLQVLDPAKKLKFMQQVVLSAAITQFLVEQAASISFVFAHINLVPPSPTTSWLTPVSSGYTYFQTGAGDGYLVVLSATDGRDISRIGRQVDPDLLSGTGNGFFAISEGLLLQHVIMPTLPTVYPNTDASYFSFDSTNNVIKAAKPIQMNEMKVGLINYYPRITSLQIRVSGSNIVTSLTGDCDMHAGIGMTFSITSTSACSFDAGNGALSLAKDPNPQVSHDSQIPWWAYLIGIGSWLVLAILAIVVKVIANGIADGLTAAFKGMSFANAGPQSVRWAGMKAFTIAGGELNGGFRLWGKVG